MLDLHKYASSPSLRVVITGTPELATHIRSGRLTVFCSTVIATINRPSLSTAVWSVLNQEFTADDFEVIIVNDTGQPLPEMDWQRSSQVRIVTTSKRKSCVARNTGAALARGKYVYFLDDDNIMLPGAMQAFWELDQTRNAVWLYGYYQTMDDDGNVLDEIRPQVPEDMVALLLAGEWIPIQASLFRIEPFFAAGAFDTSFISIAEDIDLGRRLALLGDVAGTTSLVARIRGGQAGSSADWSRFAEFERLGREKVLNWPKIRERLSRSVGKSSYLRGRVARICLASLMWNIDHGRYFLAASRLSSILVLSGFHMFSNRYWRGLRRIITE